MQVEAERDGIIERIAALDVSKAEVVCCARVPGPGRQRMQEVRTVSTMTTALLGLGDWLTSLGVTRVVMEATSDYWRAPFYLLEDRFETWLVNAHDVKHLPGRPKTDRLDAVWLAKVAERQMLPAKLRPAAGDPQAAGPDPLPRRPGSGADRGEAAGGEAAGGRPDQAVHGGHRHHGGLRAGHAGGADRRAA